MKTALNMERILEILAKNDMKTESSEEGMLHLRYGSLKFQLDTGSPRQIRRSIQMNRKALQEEIAREQKEGTALSHCGLSQKMNALAAWEGIQTDLKHYG